MDGVSAQTRVLIADDNLNVRKILAVFLQSAGYDTIEVNNGRDAFACVSQDRPDLVLLDIMMPILDGFEVCRKIKDHPDLRDTPIIMCTARTRKEDLVAAIRAGAEDYIVKPFTREIVIAKVERTLNAKKTKSSSALRAVERRTQRRAAPGWKVSWGKIAEEAGLPALYKARVLDISKTGFGFELNRCGVCTGYDQGTVHPLCLLAKHATRFEESVPIQFVLNYKSDIVLEAEGRIAHVLQEDQKPSIEKIGVQFTTVPDSCQKIIDDFVEERLQV